MLQIELDWVTDYKYIFDTFQGKIIKLISFKFVSPLTQKGFSWRTKETTRLVLTSAWFFVRLSSLAPATRVDWRFVLYISGFSVRFSMLYCSIYLLVKIRVSVSIWNSRFLCYVITEHSIWLVFCSIWIQFCVYMGDLNKLFNKKHSYDNLKFRDACIGILFKCPLRLNSCSCICWCCNGHGSCNRYDVLG